MAGLSSPFLGDLLTRLQSARDPVAEINNWLLPVFMITFGVGLVRYREAAA